MSDYRSEAEKFVTEFLDYIYEYDIKDALNKQTQQMERSPGVQKLISQAEQVFPERKSGGVSAAEMRKLSEKQVDEAIADSSNVLDTRAMFARKVSENGGLRGLVMRSLGDGSEEAQKLLKEFVLAERGKKEFREDMPE